MKLFANIQQIFRHFSLVVPLLTMTLFRVGTIWACEGPLPPTAPPLDSCALPMPSPSFHRSASSTSPPPPDPVPLALAIPRFRNFSAVPVTPGLKRCDSLQQGLDFPDLDDSEAVKIEEYEIAESLVSLRNSRSGFWFPRRSPSSSFVSYQVDSYATLAPYFQEISAGRLFLWDVDDVLIHFKDWILKTAQQRLFRGILESMGSSPAEIARVSSTLFQIPDLQEVLEEEILRNILQGLREMNAKTIALTASGLGPYGTIPSLVDWRIACLKAFGIDFSASFPEIPSPLLLPDPLSALDAFFNPMGAAAATGPVPIYKEGVVFTGGLFPKGEVLAEFLKKSKHRPSSIFFVDDMVANILSVQQMCEEMGISYRGFHYTGAKQRSVVMDQALARAQVEEFVQSGVWRTDREILEQRLENTIPEGKQEKKQGGEGALSQESTVSQEGHSPPPQEEAAPPLKAESQEAP